MADDNTSRYRPIDSSGRGPAQSAPANDPLAELARLIGQSHPHSEFGGQSPPSQRDDRPFFPQEPEPHFGSDGFAQQTPDPVYHYQTPPQDAHQDYGTDPAAHYSANSEQRYGSEPEQRYDPGFPPRTDPGFPPRTDPELARHYSAEPARAPASDGRSYGDERAPRYSDPTADWPGSAPPQQQRPQPVSEAFARPPSQPAAEPHYDPQHFPDPRFHPQPDGYDAGQPGYAPGHAGYDAQGYPLGMQPPGQEGYELGHDGRGMPAPHADEFYDDGPRGGGRKGVLTVAAVMALAVLGTAGAFGYRSIFGIAQPSAPPPVIRASGEPSKVAPPPVEADQTVNKFSYDRFGDRGKDEQVVLREEKPVDPRDLARSVAPRGVPAGSAAAQSNTQAFTAQVPSAQLPANPQAPANPPSALGEPRRVHTVPIRPDRPEPAIPPTVAPGSMAAASPTETLAPPAQSAAPPVAARVPPARNANPRVAARTQQAPAGNAPLSLSPDASNNMAAAAPPPPMRESAAPPMALRDNAPPPTAAPAPRTRVASAPAAAGGGFLVQVSSQRSEADAQSAYQNIQGKYSSVLGGQPHMVKRADLGTRGVYYRAMIGPFRSREQAIQLCSNLKSAGGDCVVQAN